MQVIGKIATTSKKESHQYAEIRINKKQYPDFPHKKSSVLPITLNIYNDQHSTIITEKPKLPHYWISQRNGLWNLLKKNGFSLNEDILLTVEANSTPIIINITTIEKNNQKGQKYSISQSRRSRIIELLNEGLPDNEIIRIIDIEFSNRNFHTTSKQALSGTKWDIERHQTNHLPSLLDDIENHKFEIESLDKTEQESIIKSRIGQGKFRQKLIKLWGRCSVTGITDWRLLKASHIKPWRLSSNFERLDPYNGLLLIPNLDHLFDVGLISFTESGDILFSNNFSIHERKLLHLNQNLALSKVYNETKKYLNFHRIEIFIE